MMRILVVDDEKDLVRVLLNLLEDIFEEDSLSKKVEIDKAFDGEEGLKLINFNAYDILFTDLNIPKVDGLDFIRIIRTKAEQNKDIPIVLLTGEPSDSLKEEEVFKTIYFLPRPFFFEDVKEVINKVMRDAQMPRNSLKD